MTAAGVLFFCDGKILLMKRAPGDGRDHPGVWSFPAGHIEEGETPEIAARREVLEETGHVISAPMKLFDSTDTFATFAVNGEKFPPVICSEHSECGWFDITALPEPLHPGVQAIVDRIRTFGMAEIDVARMIMSGELTSPQHVENMWLFDLRITGTGTAYRRALDELVYRPPEHYLNDDFLARCNGLPVIFQHPDKKILNSAEFSDRIVGTVMLPYIKVNEVWGISRIYDEDTAAILNNKQFSTSPTVVFRDETVNNETIVENGGTLLIEGKPSLLDHLALCEAGVWDKGGEPSGVISNELATREDNQIMPKEPIKADEDTGNLDKVLAAVDSLGKKVDSVATRMDAYDEKVAVADKKRADEEAEAKAKADAEAKEAEEKAKADAEAKEKEEAEEKAKADAEAAAKKEEEDKKADADCEAEMADAQSKADSLCGMFGKAAPVPRKGESPKAYRRRVAAQYAGHSPAYKGVKIEGIADDALFEIAEKQIYADALEAAHNPGDVAEGTLREVIRADVTGRRVSTFHGTPNAWMGQFKLPGRQLVGINKEH